MPAGLAPGARVSLGFGGMSGGYELVGRADADASGAFSVSVPVPSWAEPNVVYYFFVNLGGGIRTLSDPFLVTSPEGALDVTGTVVGKVLPLAASWAPGLPGVELAQPRPPSPKFPQGHGEVVPSPKQKETPPCSHSSGTPLPSWSRLDPKVRSQESGTLFMLQSGAPDWIAQASPIWSLSQSC
jgi:hypothetical protein